jgi:hypothetical protein
VGEEDDLAVIPDVSLLEAGPKGVGELDAGHLAV